MIYSENLESKSITVLLYIDAVGDITQDFIRQIFTDNNCCYSWVISPLHTPDEKDKKPHRHMFIHCKNNLSFKKIDSILKEIYSKNGGQYPFPLVVSGGKVGERELLRYFIHSTSNSGMKQQFDTRDVIYYDVETDDNGICKDNKLLWARHPSLGILSSSDFDYWTFIKLTDRERSAIKSDMDYQYLEELQSYAGSHKCTFSDIAEWAIKNGFGSCVLRYAYFLNCYIKSKWGD